ncbi:MAG TPA: hypothetical protein PLR76_09980 [Hyphomonas sp.]|nr:hypothetical protein [Hyphomonas sp.]MCC0017529.1 hypothetical protein [Rhodobiaceae bacterium]MCA8904838.1 hypothetical protein [Hyphomonas sp.]MCB9961798.1 hypothetical protein [Hyphomonas sp.]MCB9972707.1 hypothetical protein [Hyphomonas sp.]
MHYGAIISSVALTFGAVLGLGGLFAPGWAAGIVRLIEDPDPLKPGGFSEFRATFGGLFLFSHMMALAIVVSMPPVFAVVAVLPIAVGWIGAALGRALSLVADRNRNREAGLIPVWIVLELIIGLAIAAPLAQFIG